MIWIGNVPGVHIEETELRLGDESSCDCAWCLCERSGGLFIVGPVQHCTEEERIALHRFGTVGLYRVRSKPWKNGAGREVHPVRRSASSED